MGTNESTGEGKRNMGGGTKEGCNYIVFRIFNAVTKSLFFHANSSHEYSQKAKEGGNFVENTNGTKWDCYPDTRSGKWVE